MGDWRTSDRKQRLPANWPTIRKTVLTRDPVCTCRGCPRCTDTGCLRDSTDADHVIPIDDHTLGNLAGMCGPCHLMKTGQDNANYNRRRAALRNRPPEQHPGALPTLPNRDEQRTPPSMRSRRLP